MLAVVVSKSPTGDVYVVDAEDVKEFVKHGYIFGGHAETEEEAIKLAGSFC